MSRAHSNTNERNPLVSSQGGSKHANIANGASISLPQTPPPHKQTSVSTFRAYFELTRLHKFPAGNVLLFVPCFWGLTFAAYATALPPRQLALQTLAYLIGGTIVHSAACVINDICDREYDGKVERTKNRPLVTGQISVSGATVFLMCWVGLCVGALALTQPLAFKVGMIGLFPLHAFYPLMKRWTFWPQAWLGPTMNWGILVAWIDVTGQIDFVLLGLLLLSATCWTIIYDTIYACQDRDDDVTAGVKSTALLFGSYVRPILSLFAVVSVAALADAGTLNEQGIAFYVVSVGGMAVHYAWQLGTLKEDEGEDCWRKFKSNGDLGYVVWAGILLDYYVKYIM